MEFPHILLSLPKLWPLKVETEKKLSPCLQVPSLLPKPWVSLESHFGFLLANPGSPSCMNQQTWAAGSGGGGCRTTPYPPITAWLPAPERRHVIQFAISSLWTAASLPSVGSHQAPHICSSGDSEDFSHHGAMNSLQGFYGCGITFFYRKPKVIHLHEKTHLLEFSSSLGTTSTCLPSPNLMSCFLYLPFLTLLPLIINLPYIELQS